MLQYALIYKICVINDTYFKIFEIFIYFHNIFELIYNIWSLFVTVTI